MSHEKMIKRTVYTAKCECGHAETLERDPPRERQCPDCGKWMRFEEESYVGPELGNG